MLFHPSHPGKVLKYYLGNMTNCVNAVQVGNGACDFQDAVMGAGGVSRSYMTATPAAE